MATEWVQPDGTHLKLRVIGDQYYARTVTEDGYTVVFDEAKMRYDYANLAADGEALVSSGVAADQLHPIGLLRHLKEPAKAVKATREANTGIFETEREEKWAARVRGSQQRRGLDVGPMTRDAAVAGAPVSGAKLGLMILAEFPDDPATGGVDPINFPTTQAKIQRFCNDLVYAEDGNTGSIRRYYWDQSGSLLDLTHTVTVIVRLPHQ